MQQFELKRVSPLPALDRSAEIYARCAGYYLYAMRQDADNLFARDAEKVLMAKALAVGGGERADTLHDIRDKESVSVGQRVQERADQDRKSMV